MCSTFREADDGDRPKRRGDLDGPASGPGGPAMGGGGAGPAMLPRVEPAPASEIIPPHMLK